MPAVEPLIFLVIGVVAVNGIAGRIGVPAPILLLVAGVGVSFIPGVPEVQVEPEVVLTVLIPPLLFAAATEASVVALRGLLRSITQLAVGMVLVTAFAVAAVAYLLIPGIPFAAALALGAIVAPPDAVAAIAVARRAGLPRRVVTVLEGESLFNDATSLVLLRVALVGLAVGSMSWGDAVLEFAWATVGGLLIGKLMYKLSGGKINPLIGSAGVSAVPMAARVSQIEGAKARPGNYLLMHAMGPNVAGVIGSAIAAGVLLSLFR